MLLFTKGAPDVLLARCTRELIGAGERPLDEMRRREILEANDALAGRALRTLGVAYHASVDGTLTPASLRPDVERDLVFAGLIGMIDPPRDEARDAVARAKGAGIRPVVITGDHPRTAAVIAQELGIAGAERAVTGIELQSMSDEMLYRTAPEVSVYARVNPEHKLRIVRALQHHGSIVAMTGDGVNDAPALKTADIGVAMGVTGTDVSKQAADMVLADDNFATIVAAVEEGRAIFSNIRKFLRYLLSSNIGEVLTMFFGVVLAPVIGLALQGDTVVLPLLATQLLWINLITDGPPALALGVDPPDDGLMHQRPRPSGERVITRRMWVGILLVGVVMAAGTLYVLDASLPGGMVQGTGTLQFAQTKAFTTLILFQLFNVFNARSDSESAVRGLFSNRWLWAAIALSVALQCVVLYTPFLQRAFSTQPLSGADWLYCAAIASSVLWLREIEKFFYRRQATADRTHSI
jgi:Ca2+-transporting ATPase